MTSIAACHVVTSWSPEGHGIYGKRFLQGFRQFWPQSVGLTVWGHGSSPEDLEPRIRWRDLETDPDFTAFRSTYGNVRGHGAKDPVRFSHKVFAIAATITDRWEWLIWLDGDVRTMRPIGDSFARPVLQKQLVFLGRPWFHYTEGGFYGLRIGDPEVRGFILNWRRMFTQGHVMKLVWPNDCGAFDAVREQSRLREHDLCRAVGITSGIHVWPKTVLARWLVHDKGPRKKRSTDQAEMEIRRTPEPRVEET